MKKNTIFAVVMVCLAFIGASVWLKIANNNPRANSNELIVGTTAGYAPFVSINTLGEYEGFDIDVANALAQRMGKTLILKDLGSMASLLTALDQGTIDVIIWGLSITQDRLQKIAMVHYQGQPTTSYPLMFWNSIPENVQSLKDMYGKTICAEPSSAQDTFLSKYPEIAILPTEKIDDALLCIRYDKADGALVEWAIAKKFKAKYPEIKILELPLDPSQQEQGVGIAIKQNNIELINEVQTAVNALQSTNVISDLEEKWSI